MKIYQVGGAVRDELLGLPVKDRDWVVVGSTPEEMQALGYKAVGKEFPVFLHPETKEEYALARTERKTSPGYKGFQFNTSPTVTLEQDLQRRDLTINAIAKDQSGNFIDIFDGENDLKSGVLRHVSESFKEDPVRVLRVARFAARFNFRVADETLQLMGEITASGEIEALVPERVWAELESALKENYPVLFFEILKKCDALKILFPEIYNLYGIPQPEKHHPEIDCGVHTMMVLEQCSNLTGDPVIRFAALVHDLGKATTQKKYLPAHHGHEERGVRIIEKLCDRYRIPNKFRELAVLVARHHLDAHRLQEMRPETILKKLDALDAFRRPERFEQFLIACEADARGRKGFENNDYLQSSLFKSYLDVATKIGMHSVEENDLSGKDIARKISELRIKAISEKMIN